MTILYSFYSSQGIVFAADSRITRRGQWQPEPSQKKVRQIPRIGLRRGLVGYYGLAEVGVGKEPMSEWLAQMIERWPGSHSPEEFGTYLVDGLARDTTSAQRKCVSGLHVGAFRSCDGRIEPVFLHIRNTHDFDKTTGKHIDIGDFWFEEQFMARDVSKILGWQPHEVRNKLRLLQQEFGLPYWYRNGDLAMFPRLTDRLKVAFTDVSRLPGYRPPVSLNGWERLARTMVITTTQVARCFYRESFPTIGDRATVLSEPWPATGP